MKVQSCGEIVRWNGRAKFKSYRELHRLNIYADIYLEQFNTIGHSMEG